MAQYDKIVGEYVTNKSKTAFREDVEYHTFLYQLLLPALDIENRSNIDLSTILANYRLLDLGCGAGYYTRKMKANLGCKEIIGADISANMITKAHIEEQTHPLGITYYVCDIKNLDPFDEKFDIIIAFYLLNYAKTSDELDRMVQVISEQLKDGNKTWFLSITWNVCNAESIVNTDRYRKYGYTCEAKLPIIDGVEVKNTHFDEKNLSFSYISYYLSPSVYEQAFQKAGFKYFRWVSIATACAHEHYSDLLKNPPVIGIVAHK